jgi:hypothetical protein
MQGTRNIRNWVPVFTGNPGFLLPCLPAGRGGGNSPLWYPFPVLGQAKRGQGRFSGKYVRSMMDSLVSQKRGFGRRNFIMIVESKMPKVAILSITKMKKNESGNWLGLNPSEVHKLV